MQPLSTFFGACMMASLARGTHLLSPHNSGRGQIVMENPGPTQDLGSSRILTNILGTGAEHPEIRILDLNGTATWSWNVIRDVTTKLPGWLHDCLSREKTITDVKQSEDGSLIGALYGDAAIVIKHSPGDARNDKRVIWGVCMGDLLEHSHALEFLPDHLLAVATSGQSQADGIAVYNMSLGLGRQPTPVQNISKIPDVHALVWEENTKTLWTAGTNSSIDGDDPASGLINGYLYRSHPQDGGPIQDKPVSQWHMPNPSRTYTEWRGIDPYEHEWSAPHDLVLVPGQRILLIPTDLDLYALDMSTGNTVSGRKVVDTYLAGFATVGVRRGKSEKGLIEELPYSDIKSISFGADDTTVHVQAKWKDFFADSIHVLRQGVGHEVHLQGRFYRARWFKSR